MPLLHDQIQAMRSTLTPAQARIAEFLLANPLNAALLTASELAQQVDVDPATVVRFAQKLEYDGYLALKDELRRMVRDSDSSTLPLPGSLGQALEQAVQALSADFNALWDSIDKSQMIQVVELLGMPTHLLLLSDETCDTTARWLALELRDRRFRIDHPGEDPDSLAESMLSLQDYDRTLILEGLTPSPTLERIARELQRKKARSLAILGSSGSQVAHYVDSVLSLQSLRDPATYPPMLQQLLATILHAVRQLQEAYQNDGELKGDPQGEGPLGKNTL